MKRINKPVILIAEDNQDTADNLQLYLNHHQFECIMASDGVAALALFQLHQPDLVLLDWMMPGLDGMDVCKRIRAQSACPIIMLTARVSSDDLVKGLQVGADEYVKKPFEHKELVARIDAHLRRMKQSLSEVKPHKQGPWYYDLESQHIHYQHTQLSLTKTEYRLLLQLIQSPGRVFTREQLFLSIFNHDSDSSDRTVDVHLHNIRKKLSNIDPQSHGISAVYGVGYRLDLL